MQNRRVAAAFNRWLVPLAEGAPRIQSIAQLPDGSVRLEHSGATNEPWKVQATVNFSNWTDAGLASLRPDGRFEFIDTNAASFPRRFYRVASP